MSATPAAIPPAGFFQAPYASEEVLQHLENTDPWGPNSDPFFLCVLGPLKVGTGLREVEVCRKNPKESHLGGSGEDVKPLPTGTRVLEVPCGERELLQLHFRTMCLGLGLGGEGFTVWG